VLMLVILGPIFTVVSRPLGQANPTEQRQTIEAIVNPRLSATARARTTLTATYSFQSTLDAALALTLTSLAGETVNPASTLPEGEAAEGTLLAMKATKDEIEIKQTIG